MSLRAVGTPGRPSVVIDALDGRRWIGPGAAGLTAGSTIGTGTAFEIRAVAPGDVYQDARVVEGRLEVRRGPRSGPLRTIYASPRTAVPARSLILQSDGNVVLRSADGRPVWSTGTSTPSGAYLMMQTDGNLVLYRATDGRALWSSRTGRLA